MTQTEPERQWLELKSIFLPNSGRNVHLSSTNENFSPFFRQCSIFLRPQECFPDSILIFSFFLFFLLIDAEALIKDLTLIKVTCSDLLHHWA